jgi:hypothetical protein
VRELPRQLSAEELTPLFSGRTRLVDELAAREHPLEVAEEVALGLPETDQVRRERLGRTRAEELETGLRALCEIARARWEQNRWTRTT